MGFPGGSDVKEYSCSVGDVGSIPGLEQSPGGGHCHSRQYCIPMAIVQGSQRRTCLRDLSIAHSG